MAELKVKISADTHGFTQGMNFSKKEVAAWNRVLEQDSARTAANVKRNFEIGFAGIAGAAAIAAVGINESLDFAKNIQNMGDRTGIAAEFLQKIGLEAALAGSSVDEVVNFMEKLAANSQRALGGNKELQQTFERMGLSLDELENASIEDIFKAVRLHMRETKLDAESMADLLRVGDEGAGKLIPMLRGGDASGSAINTNEEIARLKALSDNFDGLWAGIRKGIRSTTDSVVFPVVDFLNFGGLSRDLKKAKEQEASESTLKTSARLEAEEKKKQAEEDKKRQKEEEAHAKKIAALQEQVNKSVRDYQFSRLKTDEERIAFLEAERDRLAAITADFTKPEEERLKATADLNQKQQQIDDLKDKETDRILDELGLGEADKKDPFRPKSDNLVSVGNFLGSDPNRGIVSKLDEVKRTLDDIRQNTRPSPGIYP